MTLFHQPLLRGTSTTLVLLLMFAQGAASLGLEPTGSALREERRALHEAFAAELEALAVYCESQGWSAEAARTRQWIAPDDPRRIHVVQVPRRDDASIVELSSRSPTAADERVAEPAWTERFVLLREKHGAALLALARRAIREDQGALAYQLVLEATRETPNEPTARRLLGYQRDEGAWYTPFELRKRNTDQVWHEQFGWLLEDHVARYEAGQRYDRGRWLTAEEDATRHEQIDRGWTVESEHYTVITNHSLEAGVALSAKLERLYAAWQQVFATYRQSLDEISRQLSGGGRSIIRGNRQHRVVYFRDRSEYIAALRPAEPRIEMTIGIYFEEPRTAYFFAGDDYEDGTLYHEATHQLFSETRRVARDAGLKHNFWIVEGVALYFESLALGQAYDTLGGSHHIRVIAARQRVLDDGFYVPLAELVSYGRERLQSHPDIAKIYSQAAGLTHFLMHYNDGQYREALVQYLLAVYTNRARPTTLAALTGTSFNELDQQYREFLTADRLLAESSVVER